MRLLFVGEIIPGMALPYWLVLSVAKYSLHNELVVQMRIPLFVLKWQEEVWSHRFIYGWYTPLIKLEISMSGIRLRWRMDYHSPLMGKDETISWDDIEDGKAEKPV